MLSPIRKNILAFLAAHVKQHGFPPTVREVAAHVGRPISTVHKNIKRLEMAGYLTTTPKKYRSARLTHKGWTHVRPQKDT